MTSGSVWKCLAVGCVAIMAVARTATGLADTITVGPAGADHTTIQAAIDAAEPGDTIVVAPGNYNENLNFKGKSIILRSSGGATVTSIIGNAYTFQLSSAESADTVIDGFTISTFNSAMYLVGASPLVKNAIFTGCAGNYTIYASDGAAPRFQNVVFQRNRTTYTVYGQRDANLTFDGCTFDGNSANYGGGIYVTSNAVVTVRSSNFTSNTSANNGGAIYAAGSAQVLASSCMFSGNHANNGGAVHLETGWGRQVLRDCTFKENSAAYGGAVYARNVYQGYFADNVFLGNTATSDGGAIYAYTGSHLALFNNTLAGNEATRGAGVFVHDSTGVLMLHNIVTDSPFGNGVATNSESVRLLAWYNDVWGNAPGNYSGIADPTGQRGNLSVDPQYSAYDAGAPAEADVTLLDSSPLIDAGSTTFVDADGTPADLGAGGANDDVVDLSQPFVVSLLGDAPFRTINDAIDAAGEGDTIVVGPGVYYGDVNFRGKGVTVRSAVGPEATAISGTSYAVTFASSESAGTVLEEMTIWSLGGYGIYTKDASPTLIDNHVRLCRGSYAAYHSGGAPTYIGGRFENNITSYTTYFDATSQPVLTGVTFRDNRASNGGAMTLVAGSDATVSGCVFEGNEATSNYGGAIYTNGRLQVSGCVFRRNEARNGGAIYTDTSTPSVLIRDSSFAFNAATNGGGLFLAGVLQGHVIDNVFMENEATTDGGGVYTSSYAHTAFINNTLVGNYAIRGASLFANTNSDSLFLQNIVAHAQSGEGLYTVERKARALVRYNAFFENEGGDFGGAMGDLIGTGGNLYADPGFVAYSLDGDDSNDELTLAEDSAIIDAGLPEFLDEDGSVADLGAGGGDDDRLVSGGDLQVSPLDGADYHSLVAAVAAASSGERVLVYPGVYYGDVSYGGADVEVKGVVGPDATVIVGASVGVDFRLSEGAGAVLDGATVWTKGNYGLYTYNTSPQFRSVHVRFCYGSYAAYHKGGAPSYTDVVFADNDATYTTYLDGETSLEVAGSRWSGNRSNHGGGLYAVNGADVRLAGSTFESNAARSNYGGAIYVYRSSLLAEDSRFADNTAATAGGALYVDASGYDDEQVTLRSCTLSGNQAANGGALFAQNCNLHVVDCVIAGNIADYGGAAFANSGARATFLNDTIVENQGGLGGGLNLADNTNTLIANTIVAFNEGGYGINGNSRTTRLLVSYSDLYANEGGNYGGALIDWTNQYGNVSVDPAFVSYTQNGDPDDDDLTLRVSSPLIDKGIPGLPDADGSTSDMGAGGGDDDYRDPAYTLYVSPLFDSPYTRVTQAVDAASSGDRIGVYPGIYYGDIDFGGKDVAIEGVFGRRSAVLVGAAKTLTATRGEGSSDAPVQVRGLALWSMGSHGVNVVNSHLRLEDCSVRYCYSSYALYAEGGTLDLDRSLVEYNAPSYTAYYTSGATGAMVGTTFRLNTSSHGGAIFATSSVLDIRDGHFLDNHATSHYGGAIYAASSTLSVDNTVFQYNGANYGGALYQDGTASVLTNNAWSYNNGVRHGGAIYAFRGSVTATNNLFAANETGGYGGVAYVYSSEDDDYVNNNFIGNTASRGSAFYVHSSTLDLVNDIIGYHASAESVYLEANATYSIAYCDFYANNQDVGGALSTPPMTNLPEDPTFVRFTDDGDPLNDDYHLASDSPLIDAGHPDMTDSSDGSRVDIGMYGGAGGPVLDNDGDGYTTASGDCDDADATTFPGAWEIQDGRDNDCNGIADDPYLDQDGDGYSPAEGDCDDTEPHLNPAMAELCDGVDQDCDGTVDDGVMTTFYLDADGDGYGLEQVTEQACETPEGYAAHAGDCNDLDASVKPSATETCDGIDNDCDEDVDEGLLTVYYTDADADGYGDANLSVEACSRPEGTSLVGGDCDENDGNVHPGAEESCNEVDDDCDGVADEGLTTTYYLDIDGDGHGDSSHPLEACAQPDGYAASGNDCDPDDPDIHPGAEEVCDGIDNDCDGVSDEGLAVTYYRDGDGDGYGLESSTQTACSPPVGYVEVAGDCDDTREDVKPGAEEVCDTIDNDCDGVADELVADTWYLDVDADGYGDPSHAVPSCQPVEGYALEGGDCNDQDDTVHPLAPETCNEVDDDCDGTVDEGLPMTTYYQDNDGDGYGASSATRATCIVDPHGYVTQPGDCDDNDSAIHPGAAERCNDADDDCDGDTDEGLGAQTYYLDRDADGYGDASEPATNCSGVPDGHATVAGDCDDNAPDIHPGASEVCDGLDNDCDDQEDEDFDQDGDGALACEVDGRDADCDDGDATVFPGATELCDGVDNDCDGETDEIVDEDGDGYTGCDVPADCDDGDATVYPYADEICDGLDNDCDGFTDEGYDRDGDGFYACEVGERPADCDDQLAVINPDAEELCDGIDNDCDGETDEGVQTFYCQDADGDDYGDPATRIEACAAPRGYIPNCTDIDDQDAATYPGAPEIPDGLDNDGDGTADEGTEHFDDDGDGYTEAEDGDCDDRDVHVHPGAVEYEDGRDNDCDGYVDEDIDQVDDDGDGYSEADGDCDDAEAASHPGAIEVADGLDNDCDGRVDEDTDAADDDGDGFSEAEGDCDDVYAYTYPGAPEIGDGVDNDCDDLVDEDVDTADDDGDGFSEADGDMDDTNFDTYPGAEEIPDGRDNDGDGRVDEGTVGGDDDFDGYSENDGDCNDDDYYVNPGTGERPDNGIDDDCDGLTDESDAELPTPGATLLESSLDFGEVEVEREATGSVTVLNQGTAGLELASVTLDDPAGVFSALFDSTIIVPPGGTYSLWFRFLPTGEGTFAATATVFTGDPDNPELAVALSGTGFVPGEITPTPYDGPPGDDDDSPYVPTPAPQDTEGCSCSESPRGSLPAGTMLALLAAAWLLGRARKRR